MSRSLKKGPFVDVPLLEKVEIMNRGGEKKVLKSCKLPLTGKRVVHRIITEFAVLDVRPGKPLLLIEHAPELTVDAIRQRTAAPLEASPALRPMR